MITTAWDITVAMAQVIKVILAGERSAGLQEFISTIPPAASVGNCQVLKSDKTLNVASDRSNCGRGQLAVT